MHILALQPNSQVIWPAVATPAAADVPAPKSQAIRGARRS
jgi:hypothetical protein